MSIQDQEYSWLESTLASIEVLRPGPYGIGMYHANENIHSVTGRRLSSSAAPLGEILNQGTMQYLRKRIPSRKYIEIDNDPSPVISPISSPAPPLFTSSPMKPTINHSRYKTEICRSFKEQGHCKYGEKCQFAHGADELRTNNRHPKYKTERCRTFHSNGYCPYGPRCHFIHGEDDEKLSEIRSNRGSRHPSGQSVNQFPSSPPPSKMISDSASGLPFPDSSGMMQYRNQMLGNDESSNDSLLSFIDLDITPDPPALQITSPRVSIPQASRGISIQNGPLSMGTGSLSSNSNQIMNPPHLSLQVDQVPNQLRSSQQVHNIIHGASSAPINRFNQHAIRFV